MFVYNISITKIRSLSYAAIYGCLTMFFLIAMLILRFTNHLVVSGMNKPKNIFKNRVLKDFLM